MQEKALFDELRVDHKPGVYFILAAKIASRRRQRAFSLIEVLVAVSIIGILLSIGVAAGLRATAEARREQTRQMMEGLLAANDEYKAVRGSGISINGSSSLSSTEQFVAACLQVKTCEEIMLSALNSSTSAAFERIYKNGSIFDRWGTELEYRAQNDGNGAGPGTNVSNAALPLSRSPFFASAGPDETWGNDDDITTLQQ